MKVKEFRDKMIKWLETHPGYSEMEVENHTDIYQFILNFKRSENGFDKMTKVGHKNLGTDSEYIWVCDPSVGNITIVTYQFGNQYLMYLNRKTVEELINVFIRRGNKYAKENFAVPRLDPEYHDPYSDASKKLKEIFSR